MLESNIHSGAKYMDKLMSDHFQDAKFDEQNLALFAVIAPDGITIAAE